jgi:hypothetical protein
MQVLSASKERTLKRWEENHFWGLKISQDLNRAAFPQMRNFPRAKAAVLTMGDGGS